MLGNRNTQPSASSATVVASGPLCEFCGHPTERSYSLDNYDIVYCDACQSSGVSRKPKEEEIIEYYQGFSFETVVANYNKVRTKVIELWMRKLVKSPNARMLDVGGGGGFFAKAFEDFGLGKSTYIDLDQAACEFATDQMKLTNVFCDTVENLKSHVGDQTYDFIYLRHVVEHLTNPTEMIHTCASYLSENGVLIIQCPNGRSKEGLLFPSYWWKFLKKVKSENRWTLAQATSFSLSKKYGWGLDPIRHLWAISDKGLLAVFENEAKFKVSTTSKSLTDPVYSPYWSPSSLLSHFQRLLARIYCKFFQGMHLIAFVSRATKD